MQDVYDQQYDCAWAILGSQRRGFPSSANLGTLGLSHGLQDTDVPATVIVTPRGSGLPCVKSYHAMSLSSTSGRFYESSSSSAKGRVAACLAIPPLINLFCALAAFPETSAWSKMLELYLQALTRY